MALFQYRALAAGRKRRSIAGFTLLEILVVLVMLGILAAISAPSWTRFQANRQVTLARDELRQGIQQAQSASMTQQSSWRFSLRKQAEQWEWAVHPNEQSWEDVSAWQPLNANITLAESDTTLAQQAGTYYVRFGFNGEVKYRLSTITLADKAGLTQNRCVVISTLLGATRNGEEHLYPNNNGRYCY
ncbi:MAG: type II secretion system protein [Leptolyngbya sp. SIO1E4]|nr:type II secretion system protein [Leptolyngbya sp. SIO1E4]